MCDEVGKPCSSSTTGASAEPCFAIEYHDAVDILRPVVRHGNGRRNGRIGRLGGYGLRHGDCGGQGRKSQEEPPTVDHRQPPGDILGFHVVLHLGSFEFRERSEHSQSTAYVLCFHGPVGC